MYHHIKKLMYTVNVGTPDPRFGNMLLEQFGGANGELAAAMQYSIQGLNCDDPERKDMLMDIGTEELSHLEIVGTLARMHLKPMKTGRDAAEVDPLIAIAGGGGVSLFNSVGDAWTADYLKITGELDVDLRSNIAAEARAKIVYERLINFCDDPGSKDALQFLMTREITHMKAFTAALESMGKDPFSIGEIAPTPVLVDQYFNDSTGVGDEGETDARGPWNEGGTGKLSSLRNSNRELKTWRALARRTSPRANKSVRRKRKRPKRESGLNRLEGQWCALRGGAARPAFFRPMPKLLGATDMFARGTTIAGSRSGLDHCPITVDNRPAAGHSVHPLSMSPHESVQPPRLNFESRQEAPWELDVVTRFFTSPPSSTCPPF